MISASRLFIINSRNRETGSNTNFTYKIELDRNDYTHVCVLQASIPKSYPLVEQGWNTFTLREGLIDTLITLTPGNYTVNSLITELESKLSTASPNNWTYSCQYPASTLPDTGLLTFTVSGNSSQPALLFTDYCYELLGFDINSTNTFVSNSLSSTNVIKLQVEDCLAIHSNICNNGINNILQEIYGNADPDYSAITYQCASLEACSRELNNTGSGIFYFTLTNEDDEIIDTRGININFSILVYKKNSVFEKLENFINYFVSKF